MIYMVSKDRTKLIRRSIPAALEVGLGVTLAVEPQDWESYREVLQRERNANGPLWDQLWRVIKHKRDNIGVAAARRRVVRQAYRDNVEIMLMTDDDLLLPPDAHKLVTWLRKKPSAPGVAAWFPIYQHFLQIAPRTGVYKHNGGMGRRAFAVRPEQLMEFGCFQTRMPTNDDTDMMLRLFRAGYLPWYIHSDVVAASIALRYAPGGISSTGGTKEDRERGAYDLHCREFGPELFTYTAKGYMRTNWKRVYAKFAPDLVYPSLERKANDD